MRNVLILFLLVIVRPLSAEVSENIAYTYYVVKADSSRSLATVLNTASPIRKDGQVLYGYTTWNINWSFGFISSPNGKCNPTRVVTELSGSIKLPKLIGETTVQREEFDEFLSALRVHELGHYDIGKKAAATINRKINSLPEMPSCREVEAAANDLGYRVLEEHKIEELQYDTSTFHGRSQGAWLEK